MMYRDNKTGRRDASTPLFCTLPYSPCDPTPMKTIPKTNSSEINFLNNNNKRSELICAIMLLSLFTRRSFAQVTQFTYNFNSGNDVGWVHYHPLQPPPFNAFASWTFPPDGNGGFAYRLLGGPPQDKTGGPIRIGSFRQDAAYGE